MISNLFRRKYKNLTNFNYNWDKGKLTIPIIINIGGAAGCGKTILANKLLPYISHSNYLNTTIIRSILRTFVSRDEYPELFENTFDLGNSSESLIQAYIKQGTLITKYIENYFESIISEKQNYIIEGSNILPYLWNTKGNKVVVIDFFMEAPEKSIHYKMLMGPTHNRQVDEKQLINCRLINDYIIKEAKQKQKYVIDYTTPTSKILDIIDTEVNRQL